MKNAFLEPISFQNSITHSVDEAIRAVQYLKEPLSVQFIEKASEIIANSLSMGGKLIVAGNGGSLCDAMHFAEELTGFYRDKRKALPALALSCPGHLSCTSNDFGFEEVFARGIEAHGNEGDVFVALTTSGNSENLIRGAKIAREKGLKTIAFLGKSGGKLKGFCDIEWIVPGFPYSDRIQEAHMAAIHIIIEMIEKRLFDDVHS